MNKKRLDATHFMEQYAPMPLYKKGNDKITTMGALPLSYMKGQLARTETMGLLHTIAVFKIKKK